MNQTLCNKLKVRLETIESELRSDIASTLADLSVEGLDGWRDSDSRAEVMKLQTVTAELKTRKEQRLVRVQNAIKAIRSGSYGQCKKCGGAISDERLDVQPEAFLCIGCAAGT